MKNISATANYILAHKYTFSFLLGHIHSDIFYTHKIYQLDLVEKISTDVEEGSPKWSRKV